MDSSPHGDGIVQMSRILGLTLEKIIGCQSPEEFLRLVNVLKANCHVADDKKYEEELQKLSDDEKDELDSFPILRQQSEMKNRENKERRDIIRQEFAAKYYDACLQCIARNYGEEKDIKGLLE